MKFLLNLAFFGVYIGAFHLWKFFPLHPVAIIAVIAIWLILMRLYKEYFISPYEKFFFYLIALNLLIESFLQAQEGQGFYGCALAFAVVILFYRHFAGATCGRKCLFTGSEIKEESN